MKKFFEKFLNHEVNAEDIHECIDAWHHATTQETVFEFLGMTEDQYQIFIRYPEKVETLRQHNVASSYLGKIESHYNKS